MFGIISYLLDNPNPAPEDEKIESAISKTKSPDESDYTVSDPYSIAINSVRGRAFEAFTLFLYQDGKKFKKEDTIKISTDVKILYEKVLKKENTRALSCSCLEVYPFLSFPRQKLDTRRSPTKYFRLTGKKISLYCRMGRIPLIIYMKNYFLTQIYKSYI